MINPVPTKDARKALAQKGYVLSDKGTRDHEMFIYEIDGQKTHLHFKLSHGARDVRRDEIQISARAQGIRGDDLYRILCCEHDRAATRVACEAAIASRAR